MKLSKAKEILKEDLNHFQEHRGPDVNDAIKLHIEIATWVELCRVTSPGTVPTLFHGETED